MALRAAAAGDRGAAASSLRDKVLSGETGGGTSASAARRATIAEPAETVGLGREALYKADRARARPDHAVQ